jgi:hypothetical protein
LCAVFIRKSLLVQAEVKRRCRRSRRCDVYPLRSLCQGSSQSFSKSSQLCNEQSNETFLCLKMSSKQVLFHSRNPCVQCLRGAALACSRQWGATLRKHRAGLSAVGRESKTDVEVCALNSTFTRIEPAVGGRV